MQQRKQYFVSLPSDDPRFDELREALEAAQGQGRYSPVPRMLGEWALLGFLLVTGRIAIGGEASSALASAQTDYAAQQAAQNHVTTALTGLEWE